MFKTSGLENKNKNVKTKFVTITLKYLPLYPMTCDVSLKKDALVNPFYRMLMYKPYWRPTWKMMLKKY